MNLVEKQAQELDLCEDFVNSQAGSLGEQDRQRRREGVKVYPRASSEDEFLFSSSDTTQLGPSGVFRITLFRETSLVIYSSAPFILAVQLLLVQVAT